MEKQKFTTSIDGETLKRIKHRAIEENKTVSSLLEQIINEYLDKAEQKSDEKPS